VSGSVAQELREAAVRLEAVSDTGRLDAELLMAHALGISRSELLLRHMAGAVPADFCGLVGRRLGHEPVAYIIGVQEFHGLPFAVTPAVLIPRGDSETLVSAALEARPDAGSVLDLGTGSGALLLAVLAELLAARGIGIDRSAEAVAIAAGNAQQLGLAARADIRVSDWDRPGWAADLGRFDLVLANPPYVEDDAELEASVRRHEPAGALFAGPDGLDAYRALLPQVPPLLAPDGVALVEIGASQAGAVAELARAAGLGSNLRRDLAGRPRVLVLHS
jgi:release factor glutamine methyltransferase